MQPTGTARLVRTLAGTALVIAGAFVGAFGAVAWLAALRIPSLAVAALGMMGLGVVPIAAGMVMLWSGLEILERATLEPRRLPPVAPEALIAAVASGAPPPPVATRLRLAATRRAARRHAHRVGPAALELEVSDDGDLVYRPRATL